MLDIQEGTWLVEHVNIGFLNDRQTNGETLQFTAGQNVDVTLVNLPELENVDNLLESLFADLRSLLQERSDLALGSFDGAGNLIDVLRLDDCLDVVLQYSSEEVLQFATTVVAQDLGPVWLLSDCQTTEFMTSRRPHSHRQIFPSWASGVR